MSWKDNTHLLKNKNKSKANKAKLPEKTAHEFLDFLDRSNLKTEGCDKSQCRHSREGGNPFKGLSTWIPAFAGITHR